MPAVLECRLGNQAPIGSYLDPRFSFGILAYDLVKAAARIRDTNYPQAHDFATHNILQPPAEEETLEAFCQS